MRSHHKHSSSESHRDTSSNSNDVTEHPESSIQLKRSSSTPNLKRCWRCHSCTVLNNSVTWHCLNCECVSVVAPIYKDTLQKGCIRHDKFTTATIHAQQDTANFNNTPNNHIARCKSKPIPISISCSKLVANAMNQSTAHIDLQRLSHRYSHRPMDVCPVMVAANATTDADCYVNQVKYNEVTRFRPVAGLCPLQRHHENKSLPNIIDAFQDSPSTRLTMAVHEPMSEHFFGERIFMVNKPQPFSTAGATAKLNHGINSARKAITPIHEIQKFTRFATKSAVRESTGIKKMCTPGEACRMCNMGRCNSTNNGDTTFSSSQKNPTENPLDTSRFTITTLSRNNATIKSKDKNQTLSRNGGVLIAVRDWSMETSATTQATKNNGIPTSVVPPMSPSTDNYYEILRNPNNHLNSNSNNNNNNNNNNHQAAIDTNKEVDGVNRMAKTTATQAHIYENSAKVDSNGPIYAVVNKMNKTKNVKSIGGGGGGAGSSSAAGNMDGSGVQCLRSPEQTRFTYIGLSPTSNIKPAKQSTIESDAVHASNKSSQHHNNNHSSNNNGALTNVMMPSLNHVNNNNGLPLSNDCTPTATNVEFSTKVWKGSKKPIEISKK